MVYLERLSVNPALTQSWTLVSFSVALFPGIDR